jgi:hypothetical protein
VNLLRVENDRYVFRLGQGERELLSLILGLYPVIPSAHQPLSKSSAAANQANQHLLDEALAEQRKENKKLVQSFLAETRHFQETETSCQMMVTAGEIEWLLQVLNDVHVGSWLLLGSPDEDSPALVPNEQTGRHVGAMDLARWFQGGLLDALDKPPSGQNG